MSRRMIDTQKLKAAREAAKLSQAALARRIGAAQQLIGQLERGEVKTTKLIFKIADALGIPANSLDSNLPLFDASPILIPVVGYVGAGSEIIAIDDHAKGAGMEEVEPPIPGMSPSTVAVRVRGSSMEPAYYDGDLIFYERQDNGDLSHLIGKECIVALEDGRKFVKILKRRSNGEVFLHSNNAEPIIDVRIEWAARVKVIQRA